MEYLINREKQPLFIMLFMTCLMWYYDFMIRTFKDVETGKIFNREWSSGLEHTIQPAAYRKLRMLHNSRTINDLRVPPANRLEKLKGNREGQYSIRINDKFRICFQWIDNDAFEVEIVAYH